MATSGQYREGVEPWEELNGHIMDFLNEMRRKVIKNQSLQRLMKESEVWNSCQIGQRANCKTYYLVKSL
eukprot:XP_001706407.1 Hypothetical protein GL50803_37960 [Giardia lamblia ATCC 50803]